MRLFFYVLILAVNLGLLIVDAVQHNPISIINYVGIIIASFLIGLRLGE